MDANAIDKKLGDAQWLGGQAPGAADREAFDGLDGKVPNANSHPNAFAWYCLVSKFAPNLRELWSGGAGGAAGGKGKGEPAGGNQQEETKGEGKGKKKGKKGKNAPKEEKKDEVDEMDLFGEDNEEDKVS